MQDVFHVVKINHSLDNVVDDVKDLLFCELFFGLVDLIEKTAVLKVLSDQLVFFSSDADAHVKDYVGMFEST